MAEDENIIEFTLAPIPGLPSHTFNGLEYCIFLCPKDDRGWGYCELRDVPDRLLWIHDRPFDVFLLMVLVHEALHACFGERMSEDDVDRIAVDIAAFVGKFVIARDNGARKAVGYNPLGVTSDAELKQQIDECVAKFIGESRAKRIDEGNPPANPRRPGGVG